MFRSIVFLAVIFIASSSLCSSASLQGHRLAHFREVNFHEESAAVPNTDSKSSPNFVGIVSHLPLKGHLKLNTENPRHTTSADGTRILTIDAPITGCPSLDFSAPVTIGGQAFELIVDTGSTTLAVASTACSSSCGVSSYYTPAATISGGTNAFSSRYGDGSGWTGNAVSDSVSVGGSSAVTTILASITTQNGFFRSASCGFGNGPLPNQGIIGFAGPGIAVSSSNGRIQSDEWFAKWIAANPSTPNLFTLRMCLTSGDLWLGGYDTSSFTDQIHWASIITYSTLSPGQGYFTIGVNSFGISGGATDSTSSDFNGNTNTIVDSGTTLALVPTAVYNNIVNRLGSVSAFSTYFGSSASSFLGGSSCVVVSTAPATMNANLPGITVVLAAPSGSQPVTISLNGINFYVQAAPANGRTYYCPGIQSNSGGSDVILGWSFMNQLIVSHDLTNKLIGFAPRVGCNDDSIGAVSVSGGYTGTDATGGSGVSGSTTAAPPTTTAASTTTPRTTTTTPITTTRTTTTTTKQATTQPSATTSPQETTQTTTTTTTVSPCLGYCQNGGTCSLIWPLNQPQCSCPTGFGGLTCQTVVTTTTTRPTTTASPTQPSTTVPGQTTKSTTTTKPAPMCGGMCYNGGVPDASCSKCSCPGGFTLVDCSEAFARISFTITFTTSNSVTVSSSVTAQKLLTVVAAALTGVSVEKDPASSPSWNGNSISFTAFIYCNTVSQPTSCVASIQSAVTTALAFNVNTFASAVNSGSYSVDSVAATEAANTADGCILYADGTSSCPTTDKSSSSSSSAFPLGAIIGIAAGAAILLLAIIGIFLYRRRSNQKSWSTTVNNLSGVSSEIIAPPLPRSPPTGMQITAAQASARAAGHHPNDTMELQTNPALAAYGLSNQGYPTGASGAGQTYAGTSTANYSGQWTGTSSGYYGQQPQHYANNFNRA